MKVKGYHYRILTLVRGEIVPMQSDRYETARDVSQEAQRRLEALLEDYGGDAASIQWKEGSKPKSAPLGLIHRWVKFPKDHTVDVLEILPFQDDYRPPTPCGAK